MFCNNIAPFRRLHSLSKSIVISDYVRSALVNGGPIVALESTIITHGMPYPQNIKCAQRVQSIIREQVNNHLL